MFTYILCSDDLKANIQNNCCKMFIVQTFRSIVKILSFSIVPDQDGRGDESNSKFVSFSFNSSRFNPHFSVCFKSAAKKVTAYFIIQRMKIRLGHISTKSSLDGKKND